jgi:rare lipoprotein A
MRLPAELILAGIALAGCAAIPRQPERAERLLLYRAPVSDNLVKVGKTYVAGGRRHTPRDDRDYEETGPASWYGEELRGRPTASGERFDPDGFTAAHRTLPMPSYVEVTSLQTGRAILVRINDRGPFHGNRIIDLSLGAARQLGITGRGQHTVRVRRVEPSEADKIALRSGLPAALRAGGRVNAAAFVRDAPLPKGDGPFFLQVGSFTSETRANALADRVGGRVSSIAGTYRVRLGPYRTAVQARDALAPLAARGYPDAQITR